MKALYSLGYDLARKGYPPGQAVGPRPFSICFLYRECPGPGRASREPSELESGVDGFALEGEDERRLDAQGLEDLFCFQ